MRGVVQLKEAVNYSEDRINIDSVTLENFVTTDNLLQNKLGLTTAVNLPPQEGRLPSFNSDNILVANIRPYLKKIWFSNRNGGCSADVLVFTVKNEYDPKFVYYSMYRDDFFNHMMRGAKGTKMPRGDKNQIMEFTLPNFKKSIQKKISAVLSSLDAKIELNNRINVELEAMAKTLYDYWFVQFDFPISKEQAKAMGKPELTGKPYKSSGGKMAYNDTLKREIPLGWMVKELGTILKTSLGGTPSTGEPSYWDAADIPWLNSGEIANFPVIKSEEHITQRGIDNSAAELLPKGSVVISIVRYIRPSILGIDSATNQSVVGIYENKDIKNSFIYPCLVREVPRYMAIRTGAQQPHINKRVVDLSQVLLPEKDILQNYYCIVDPLYKEILTKGFENQQLTQLRDWLLPMLMNGQVTVK